ncbi:Nickel pincer cofactor biosynthesis protein LarC [Planctomycetales bacterium 10988]|nr:Nickel pincer cofactor biosynthesis protein LarC [Planctomycetales bacterium 10988]
MRTAYLDCASGISGDMTLAALIDLGVPLDALQVGIQSLGLPGVQLSLEEVKRKGFRASHLTVEHEPEHKHRHLHHIEAMIDQGDLTERQREMAKRIFHRIAVAEAKVHGTTLQKVHFHEVGAVDSIVDIVGFAIAWDLSGIERWVASPVPTGSGFVEIAHGRCSVPAPATAELLQGIPLEQSSVKAELTTPTGAAILAELVDAYGPVPSMRIDKIGYGAGTRELTEQPNLLRIFLGELEEVGNLAELETVWLLETNLDDLSGELIGHCTEKLHEQGALDVFTTPIQMKKGRPGVQLTVLCEREKIATLEGILFRETTALGIRRQAVQRKKLQREAVEVKTSWGTITGKVAKLPDGSERFSPEYEACRQVADSQKLPLPEVYEAVHQAFAVQQQAKAGPA